MNFISSLHKSLLTNKFTITGELTPPKGINVNDVLEGAKLLKDKVVAVNVTDNPTSRFTMSTLATCHLIEENVGLETIFQITARDRNRLALQSDIIAANPLGIKNIVPMTGDYITLGDHPEAKPVFDLDSIQLIYTIKRMMEDGVDLAGKKLNQSPKLYIGAALNPGLDPIEPEIIKLKKKIEMGAQFFQTQCMYDVDLLENFLNQIANLDIKILVGITPLSSVGMAKWMIKNCSGVIIPDFVMDRFKKVKKEDRVEEGLRMMVEFVKEISTMKINGVHVMVPERPDLVAKMVNNITSTLRMT